ncbi:MAG: ferredoxin--NADP reductase [Magnetococcus sp. XQGC-1]
MSTDLEAIPVKNMPDMYNATVIDRQFLTPLLLILQVMPDQSAASFSPGQYTVLGLRRSEPRVPEADPEEGILEKPDKLIRRAYSISSSNQNLEYLEFYISMVAGGELTPRLFYLKPGDRLFVGTGSKGIFTLDQVPAGQNILLVGTGTGLAPYMSMIRSMAWALDSLEISLAVLHGAGYSWDLGYRGELESLAQRCNKFRYLPTILDTKTDRDWQGRTGLLQKWLAMPDFGEICGMPIDPRHTHIFVCGNPVMIESVLEILTPMGYSPGNRREAGTLHLEKYW